MFYSRGHKAYGLQSFIKYKTAKMHSRLTVDAHFLLQKLSENANWEEFICACIQAHHSTNKSYFNGLLSVLDK